jgi:hypothetical protein
VSAEHQGMQGCVCAGHRGMQAGRQAYRTHTRRRRACCCVAIGKLSLLVHIMYHFGDCLNICCFPPTLDPSLLLLPSGSDNLPRRAGAAARHHSSRQDAATRRAGGHHLHTYPGAVGWMLMCFQGF